MVNGHHQQHIEIIDNCVGIVEILSRHEKILLAPFFRCGSWSEFPDREKKPALAVFENLPIYVQPNDYEVRLLSGKKAEIQFVNFVSSGKIRQNIFPKTKGGYS